MESCIFVLPDKFGLLLDKGGVVHDNFALMHDNENYLSVKIELVHDNEKTFFPSPKLNAFRPGEMRSFFERSRSPGANGFSITAFELGFW